MTTKKVWQTYGESFSQYILVDLWGTERNTREKNIIGCIVSAGYVNLLVTEFSHVLIFVKLFEFLFLMYRINSWTSSALGYIFWEFYHNIQKKL